MSLSPTGQQPQFVPKPLSKESAICCVNSAMGRAITMVEALKTQYSETKEYYQPVHKKIIEKYQELVEKVDRVEGDLSKKQVKTLAHDIQKVESDIVHALASAQRKCKKAIGHDAFVEKSRAPLQVRDELLTQVEKDRKADFERGDLKKRQGVVKVQDEFRIAPELCPKKIKKQMSSLAAQILSDQERSTIKQEMRLGNLEVTSEQCPLNHELDVSLAKKGVKTSFFSNIFGKFGISSANRQEKHIINGLRSELRRKGADSISYRCFRHGIISSKLVKGKEQRRQEARDAAKELVTAMLLQAAADRGISLDKRPQQAVALNVSSVSLVTPDHILQLIRKHKSERSMLADQTEALQAMASIKEIVVNGVAVPVNIKMQTFNFGVNDLAVWGERLRLKGIMGLSRQHKLNKAAWEDLRQELDAAIEKMPQGPKREALTSLRYDIDLLMKDKTSYLKGHNQYEIGAKIINVSNLLAEVVPGGGFFAAMNCKSGKDRTNMLDCAAKALHAMYLTNQKFPTHHELENDAAIKAQFCQYTIQFLMEAGGLTITELNTGAMGYKLRAVSNVVGMTSKEFLAVQGLSRIVAT